MISRVDHRVAIFAKFPSQTGDDGPALRGAASPIVDYLTARRKAASNSPASYLVGIAEVAAGVADVEE